MNLLKEEIRHTLNKMTERNLVQDKLFSFSTFISLVLIIHVLISLLSI